jgi:RimJ/RimL family protein N-acetyltransferase
MSVKLFIKPLAAAQIREFIQWQYPDPYAIYNMATSDEEAEVRFFQDPENGYFGISDEDGRFLGFCNFGADARVPGGDYAQEALDIGIGMRPDLTGQGQGAHYAAAVFDFAMTNYAERCHRVTIAEFNRRAQRLCSGFGFVEQSRFVREKDGQAFVILVRDLEA